MEAMVEPVPMVMQWPAERFMHAFGFVEFLQRHLTGAQLLAHGDDVGAGADILAAIDCRAASGRRRRRWSAGRTLAAPISRAGVVLSQPISSTTPSSGLARIDSSTSMAARLRNSIAVGRSQRLAERGDRKLEREAAGVEHAALHVLGERAEMRVAGRQLGPRVADADDGPAVELVLREAAVLEEGAVIEAHLVLAPEPGLAAQGALLVFVHWCVPSNNVALSRRDSRSRDFGCIGCRFVSYNSTNRQLLTLLKSKSNEKSGRKRMKARHLLTTIGMAALMLSSGAAYAQNKMTIGFSQVGSESGWRAAETKVSKIEAEKRGVDLKISDAQQKQENQIRAVRSFIAQGVDAIFLPRSSSTGWERCSRKPRRRRSRSSCSTVPSRRKDSRSISPP